MQKTLPKGWQWVKLGEVAQIVSGSTPSTSNSAYWDGDITWVTPADLSKLDTIEIKDSGRTITAEGYQSCSTTMLPAGTVLLSSRAPIGHLAIAGKKMCTNQGFKSLIPNEKAHSFYLYFILKHFKARLISLGSGATFKEISKTSVEKFEIPLPPLPTQHKIVEILEEADSLRKLRQQADEKTKDLIPSLFVQMFGDPATNPKGWEVKKLGDLAVTVTKGTTPTTYGHSFQSEGIKFLKVENISGDGRFIIDNLQYITSETNNFIKRSILKNGDILFSIAGALGRCAVVRDEILPANINQALAMIRLKDGAINLNYLITFLRSLSGFGFFDKLKVGVAQLNLSLTQLKDFKIPLPPLPLQQEFAKLVEDIEAEKARQAESRKKLDELFNSLMQRAFTGELVA